MADVTDVSALPFPELTDQPDGPGAVGDLATALDHLVIPKYANATARDNANTSPVFGDLCFVTELAGYYSYDGANWVRMRYGEQFKRQLATTSRTVTTAYQTLTDLSGFTIASGQRYKLSGQLFARAEAAADLKFTWSGTGMNSTNFPTTGDDHGFWAIHSTAFDSSGSHRSRRWSEEIAVPADRAAQGGAAYTEVIELSGLIYNSSGSPITADFRWGNVSSAGGTTTLFLVNSWIQFERI